MKSGRKKGGNPNPSQQVENPLEWSATQWYDHLTVNESEVRRIFLHQMTDPILLDMWFTNMKRSVERSTTRTRKDKGTRCGASIAINRILPNEDGVTSAREERKQDPRRQRIHSNLNRGVKLHSLVAAGGVSALVSPWIW